MNQTLMLLYFWQGFSIHKFTILSLNIILLHKHSLLCFILLNINYKMDG
jgi:hypothetical protein